MIHTLMFTPEEIMQNPICIAETDPEKNGKQDFGTMLLRKFGIPAGTAIDMNQIVISPDIADTWRSYLESCGVSEADAELKIEAHAPKTREGLPECTVQLMKGWCSEASDVIEHLFRITSVDADGNGTDISVLVSAEGPAFTKENREIVTQAIEKCRHDLKGEWQTDACFKSAIEALKSLGYQDVRTVLPTAEIEF